MGKKGGQVKKRKRQKSEASTETSSEEEDTILESESSPSTSATKQESNVQRDRIKLLNARAINSDGEFVLYWMQASVRVEYNMALEYAISQANDLNLPLVAFFGITDNYPEANERHYAFMLEGLREASASLQNRGVQLVLWKKSPELGASELSSRAALVVTDCGYVRIQREWRSHLANKANCRVVQVEDNVVVPVEVVSKKEEFAARTIRPKVMQHLKSYLVSVAEAELKRPSLDMSFDSLDPSDVDALLASLTIDRSVPRVSTYVGGTSRAKALLEDFVARKLKQYAVKRNEPSLDCVSHMSPYLHFGHISPIYIAQQVINKGTDKAAKDAYIEELVVRRELSMNFCTYNPNYDRFDGLPDWAKASLRKHQQDKRPSLYTEQQLERAETHDPYWNASQNEMRLTGKMHNYMRMYWGKKILEWVASPEDAFDIALRLNNKYHLDGRDPNSFTGVAWIFGKHDRPWGPERPVFGLIRYMNSGGLERKLDIKAYVAKINRLLRATTPAAAAVVAIAAAGAAPAVPALATAASTSFFAPRTSSAANAKNPSVVATPALAPAAAKPKRGRATS